jgi:UDP-glucuronate decarboxylase
MSIRWITPLLGTAPFSSAATEQAVCVIDVRDLADKEGNPSEAIAEKVQLGVKALRSNRPVLVCCDQGMSRSNAVAVGILTLAEGIPFTEALQRVIRETGEGDIKTGPLQDVCRALGQNRKKACECGQQRLLLAGASGFIGSGLNNALKKDCCVTAPSSQELDLSQGAAQLSCLAETEQATAIVHLAQPRIFSTNTALGASLTMLRNVLDVCCQSNIPLIYLSSAQVYGGYQGTLSADEATPPCPQGPYGEAKYLSEQLISQCIARQGLRCALLRCATVYGPGSNKPRFIHNFIQAAAADQPISCHRFTNGKAALDLLHLDDLDGRPPPGNPCGVHLRELNLAPVFSTNTSVGTAGHRARQASSISLNFHPHEHSRRARFPDSRSEADPGLGAQTAIKAGVEALIEQHSSKEKA